MGFDIQVGDKVVHTLDVDPRLVGGFTVGVDTLPVQFSQESIRLDPVFKSPNDAEYLASLQAEEDAERKAAVEEEHAKAVEEVTDAITDEEETTDEAEAKEDDKPELVSPDVVAKTEEKVTPKKAGK